MKYYSLGIDWEDFGLISYDQGKIVDYKSFTNDFKDETFYLLDFLKENKVKCTFFINARTAEIHPKLTKIISQYGHAIGSHGYKHVSRQSLTNKEFLDDSIYSKNLIEDIIQKEVVGYRSPLLSISRSDYLDSLRILKKAGYQYDSSITVKCLSKLPNYPARDVIKIIPLTSVKFGFISLNLAGGSTWRILPSFLTSYILKSKMTSNNSSFYLHPYEFGNPINPCRGISSKANILKKFAIYLRWNFNKNAIEEIITALANSQRVSISEVK
ncbi:polysaccharide deacetylase family protein [Prochlorococcus sp. MIT 1223]|uniref:polysaccharide deacetylase family protein n=1 Tax=Prochlorococcus sp. MIT 1223 TaxID=3096217 RepID=UPI002A756EA5|nr:polysaccharide deacetylase family protein [Prochlorococcus sp. MIT 1223]